MEITLKLMGVLKDKTSDEGKLKIADGATILDVLTALDIPSEGVQTFTVNGQLERDRNRSLSDGDDLAILPPVGGG